METTYWDILTISSYFYCLYIWMIVFFLSIVPYSVSKDV